MPPHSDQSFIVLPISINSNDYQIEYFRTLIFFFSDYETIMFWHNLTFEIIKRRVVASIPHCVCLSVCLSVGRSVCRSKNLKIGIMSISSLKLNYLSTVIPQTIINELLAGTVPLKNHLPEPF